MNKHTKLIVLAVILASSALLAGFRLAGQASTSITVTTLEDEFHTDGDCSLREAIAAANTNTAVDACPAGNATVGDAIQFNPSGVISLTATLDISAGAPLLIDGGQAITLRGGNSVRVFNISSGAGLTLDGLDISEGQADNGGGIYNQGNLTLKDSILSQNLAVGTNGGGGGIYNTGFLTVTGSTISQNLAMYHIGGGIYNLGQLSLSLSEVGGNSAYHDGGGIYNSGVMTITQSNIAGNSVNYKGGGFYNMSTVLVVNSTIHGNQALYGGGIYNASQVFLTNSTLSGNHAANDGGGIYTLENLTGSNVTVANNTAGFLGGGIKSSALMLLLRNSIFAGNSAGMYGPDCDAAPFYSGGYNLIGNGDDCFITPGAGDKINVDAKLEPLQNNGGPTDTHALLPGSPAIDAGNPDGCRDHLSNFLTTDQRGFTHSGRCDIGAFEYFIPDSYFHVLSLPIAFQQACQDFYDDFSDPSSGWEVSEDNNARTEYLNGEYRVLIKATDVAYAFPAPTCDRQNYSVEVAARWAGNTGAGYGLIFGIVGDFEQFYLFEINTDYLDYSLYRYDPLGWAELIYSVPPPGIIYPGQAANQLKVTRNGSNIDLEINGTLVAYRTDSTISGLTGSALVVSSYNDLPDADARFDNYRVTGLPGAADLQSLFSSSFSSRAFDSKQRSHP